MVYGDLWVLITRPDGDHADLAEALRASGIAVAHMPTTEQEALADTEATSGILTELSRGRFAWLVLTSRNGVRFLAERLELRRLTLPASLKIAVQGPGTAAELISLFGRNPELVPPRAVAEPFAAALIASTAPGEQLLIAGSENTRGVVQRDLMAAGRVAQYLPLYRTVPIPASPEIVEELLRRNPRNGAAVFYSPSAFNAFDQALGDLDFKRALKLVAVGPVTAQAIIASGYCVAAEAQEPTMERVRQAVLGVLRA